MKFKKISSLAVRRIYSQLPIKGISRPIFIIGCGRSGTTIFGTILSKHRDVTYLNEPRHLWMLAYPETDIWTKDSESHQGKLFFNAQDVVPQKSLQLSRLFRLETIMSGRPVLIEKLPINNFRLAFIQKMFPNALFIHIYRNGLEVAHSIEKLSNHGNWFGANSYKWQQLSEYAVQNDSQDILDLCKTYFEKGLLEWRLSTEASVKFLNTLPKESFFELSYDELIDNPHQIIQEVLDFIGLESDVQITTFISKNITRRSAKLNQESVTSKNQSIGGDLLSISMDGKKRLTNNSL